MRFLMFTAPAILLASGCAGGGAPVSTPTQDGLAYARIGEDVNVGGPRVTPLEVLEDSRCPAGVACVWAGRVRISARITTGPGSEVRELTLNEPAPVADGALLLANVLPARIQQSGHAPGAYRFGFRFDGGY